MVLFDGFAAPKHRLEEHRNRANLSRRQMTRILL
jgi:hypothetical protein